MQFNGDKASLMLVDMTYTTIIFGGWELNKAQV